MMIVYGPLVAYHTILKHNKIKSHQHRRQPLFEKFATKARNNPHIESRWFPQRPQINYNLRHRPEFW